MKNKTEQKTQRKQQGINKNNNNRTLTTNKNRQSTNNMKQ